MICGKSYGMSLITLTANYPILKRRITFLMKKCILTL